MNIYDKSALINAVYNAKKPIAFLVGSPISYENGKGVPGIYDILKFVQQEVEKSANPIAALASYNAAMLDKSGSEAYQTAMDWVQGNMLQDAVNNIIVKAVLNARKPKSSKEFDDDGIFDDWDISSGIHQLTWLICNNKQQFPGPILTTNFDPLLSLSLTSNGGIPVVRPILTDGSLPKNYNQVGHTEVIHLHGYWRAADTMHTPTQLNASRPRLKESLKSILHEHTLIIAAYGGWDDIFTQALAEAVLDNAEKTNILWCFWSDDAIEINKNNINLFERMNPLVIAGRFNAYKGIDCHSIFSEISAASPKKLLASAAKDSEYNTSPLLDWQLLDNSLFDTLSPLSSNDIIRYFDGAIPTLRHSLSPYIHRRGKVKEIAVLLEKAANSNKSCSLQLIRAAGGEGKTTILLQIAVDAAKSGRWKVLWRNSSQEGLSSSDIEKLDKNSQWLIVADDADNIIAEIADAAQVAHNMGLTHIHFLLAARDVDWKNAGGDRKTWNHWLNKQEDCLLNSISSDDAKSVVKSWGKFGSDGLRELASIKKMPDRALEFLNAVWDADKKRSNSSVISSSDGSFFGGLLEVRFGQGGLRAHVLTFLEHLKNITIEYSSNSSTLLDALFYISACHGAGLTGLDNRVLADLVAVPRDWVNRLVVKPLGAEAGAIDSGGHVFARHSKVAAAVIIEGEGSFGVDFAEIWSKLIRQTFEAGLDPYFDARNTKSYYTVLNAGPKLQEALPINLSLTRRKAIAITAARVSLALEPNRLSPIINLGNTYRIAEEYEQAVTLFRSSFHSISTKLEYNERVRSYMTEWAISEGECEKGRKYVLANAWLMSLSLSDMLNPASITSKDIKVICASLGTTFVKLVKSESDLIYARATRATTFLGQFTELDELANTYFNRHDSIIDEFNITQHPTSISEAIEWLTEGARSVGKDLQDPFLIEITNPQQLSFTHFHTIISRGR